MFHVFVGDDVVKVRARAHAFLEKGAAGSEVERITAESYSPQFIREQISAAALFGDLAPILVDFLSDDASALADFETCVESAAQSSRTIVLMDSKPRAALEKVLRKHAQSFDEVVGKESKKERFNTFLLADALLRKDKKSLWVLLMRARMADIAGEEIAGTLFWQLKSLRLAQNTASAAEAGMKDFMYTKAKSASRKFTKEELEKMSEGLLAVYHEGHFGEDMEVGLERFVLRI